MHPTRREFLLRSAGMLCAPLLAGCARERVCPVDETAAAVEPVGEGLRVRAERRGLLFGAAVPTGRLAGEPALRAAYARECGVVVPENALKWRHVHPRPGRYDFAEADRLADFARREAMRVRGHALVWHGALPEWAARTRGRTAATRLLESHVAAVAGRYRGRMHSWDVVNEAVHPGDRRRDGLRDTPWLREIGAEYLEIAFHAASTADPGALLMLNEYGIEDGSPAAARKRGEVLRLLERLRARAVPVHGLGIQSHLHADAPLDEAALRAFLREVAGLGLHLMITEMDVADASLPADPAARDARVAEVYARYLAVVLDEPRVTGLVTWGLGDADSWLGAHRPRGDGCAVRPLPLDAALRRKPAWSAIAGALDAAPLRPAAGG